MRQNIKVIVARPFLVVVENTLLFSADLLYARDIQDRIDSKHALEGIECQLYLRFYVNDIIVPRTCDTRATDKILTVGGITELVKIFPFGAIA